MNCSREIMKMDVPARYRGIGSEAYLNGTSQEPTPEDARLPARLRPVGDYAPEARAYSSERRTAISMVAASHSLNIRVKGESQ